MQKLRPIQNRKGAMGGGTVTVIVLLVAMLVGAAVFIGTQQTALGGDKGAGTEDKPLITDSNCPTDKDWAGVVNVQNIYNNTVAGGEAFDTTLRFYKEDGSLLASITDTTTGSVTLACGEKTFAKLQSTSGSAGDSSLIVSSDITGAVIKDNVLEFTPKGTGATFTINSMQHGLPQVKAKDQVSGELLFDNQDSDATDYETTDGVIFNGTTAGSTGLAVGSGGKFDVSLFVQSQQTDENVNDRGMYLLVDAATAVWDTSNAVASYGNNALTQVTLTGAENIAYNDYELVYLIPESAIIRNNDDLEFRLKMNALSGQDPTGAHNVSFDISPRGQFQSVEGANVLKIGAVDDSSSRGQIHTLHDTMIRIA